MIGLRVFVGLMDARTRRGHVIDISSRTATQHQNDEKATPRKTGTEAQGEPKGTQQQSSGHRPSASHSKRGKQKEKPTEQQCKGRERGT